VGAVARYLAMSAVGHVTGAGFPYATLLVNIIGRFVLGALIETMALAWSPVEAVRAFLVVGVLSAFTTFSTFSMDVLFLIERGQILQTAVYILASVILAILAFATGLAVMRFVLA